MISNNQTCAEVKSVSSVTRDWPHYAISVVHEEFPTCQEQVDEICAKTSKDVFLYYTTITTESVPESAPVIMETIEYQRQWSKDVQLWFKNRHYEPFQHSILDSAPLGNCHQGLERFAAYGRQSVNQMKQELEYSTPTLRRHQWVFNSTFCMACDRHFHRAQPHDCNRKCTLRVGETQCGKTFHGYLNLRRHQTSHDDYTSKGHDWSGQEVRIAYNLHLLCYTVDEISNEIPSRSKGALERLIKQTVYGCRVCHRVFIRRSTLESHSKEEHDTIPTQHHCYKCGEVHELEVSDACLGKQRRLDLGDRAEMNNFYEMQLRFLSQHDSLDSPELRLMVDGAHMERSEFLSALCPLLVNRERRNRTPRVPMLKRKMSMQLLRVALCEKEFVSQGKGDKVIDVSSGNLEWHRRLRSKAPDGDERPRLSAPEMGLVV